MKSIQPPRWSELAATTGVTPHAGSWKMFYFARIFGAFLLDKRGDFFNPKIKDPYRIDFNGQLEQVQDTVNKRSAEESKLAEKYKHSPMTVWNDVAVRLIDGYQLAPATGARVMSVLQAAINDAFVVCWYFKYLYDIARPVHLDDSLHTVIQTPTHPTYPSGHATVAGCAQTIINYFFPLERERVNEIATDSANSRLYAGVHFPVDNEEGLRLGRQIAQRIVETIAIEKDAIGVDIHEPLLRDPEARSPLAPPANTVNVDAREMPNPSIFDQEGHEETE
ncbi:vanadium-dependent haloperoxidase [Desertibacillus haloalkaliphilus]|uniref:vanadium-dependent haloperoxidase n=1 Tax=Desertibacillus haloalkaliphilus TaxID=1328930 RepID=UPI001C2665C8|nr:vanadium-dependent haloperoxidase [Desertibacillus haloalkaliphilus]MBU8906694.1 vanadium-dependent haloperoxidase [Desertibacillus haloalkaliphilus]